MPPSAAVELDVERPEYENFARFAELTAEKRRLQDRLNEIEPQLKALEPLLLSYLGEGGWEMVRIQGFTMSPVREPWVYPAQGVSRQVVCAALKANGLGRFVKEGFNTRTLTKYVRELEGHYHLIEEADPQAVLTVLPAGLTGILEIRPGYRLQVLDRRKRQ
jgi:hypothetical protein